MELLRKKDEEEENARNTLRDQAAQVNFVVLILASCPSSQKNFRQILFGLKTGYTSDQTKIGKLKKWKWKGLKVQMKRENTFCCMKL